MRIIEINFNDEEYSSLYKNVGCGINGENLAAMLKITLPQYFPIDSSCRINFNPGGQTDILTADKYILNYEVPAALTKYNIVEMTIEAYTKDKRLFKTEKAALHFSGAVNNLSPIEPDDPIRREVAANTIVINELKKDKLDAAQLPKAVNDALLKAKQSGDFDGKTAFEYAKQGGYSGNEKSFSDLLSICAKDKSKLYKAVITAAGDSITASSTGMATQGGFVKMISDKYSMVYENQAVGGGCIADEIYTADGVHRYAICNSIDNMRADADIILLSGGVNDQVSINHGLEDLGALTQGYHDELNKATLYGALEYMIRKAVYKWSNKTILFILVHRTTEKLQYKNAVKDVCAKYGVPVVDLCESTPEFYYLTEFKQKYTVNADGWHPNDEGYKTFYINPIEEAIIKNFKSKGETISITDNYMPNVICINEASNSPKKYLPHIEGFIRMNGTISSSANYRKTDFIPLENRKYAEYNTFLVNGSSMANWALFDSNKVCIAASEDENGTDYYNVNKSGITVKFGYKRNKLNLDEMRKKYPSAKYITVSTCVNPAYKMIRDIHDKDVGWESEQAYLILLI